MAPADRLELLDRLEKWSRRRAAEQADVTFRRGPGGRPKSAAWISADNDGRLAELIVWASGEAELSLGFDNDPRVNEHHELDSLGELDSVLERVSSWLDAAGA